MNVLIYQMGGHDHKWVRHLDPNQVTVLGMVSKEFNEDRTELNHGRSYKPQDVLQLDYDFILIENLYYDKALHELTELGIEQRKVVGVNLNYSESFYRVEREANIQLQQQSNFIQLQPFLTRDIEPFFLCNMPILGRHRSVQMKDHDIDYIRLSSLELVAHEVYRKGIQGSVAELGVYRGAFASKINALFPDRTLYLFDTFEGFDPIDVAFDEDSNYAKHISSLFADTSEDIVLSRMPFSSRCVVKKGFFPDSAADLQESSFVFVSIDADLFQPIYEGLQYFYPRLVQGGYIFVHDYNNSVFQGAKHAVQKYCQEQGIAFFPLSDVNGTAVISK